MINFIIIILNRLNDRDVMNVSVMWREDNHNVSWNLQLQAFTRKLLKFIHSLGLHRAHQAQPGTEIFLAKLSNIFQPVKYFSNNNASPDCRYIYWISGDWRLDTLSEYYPRPGPATEPAAFCG